MSQTSEGDASSPSKARWGGRGWAGAAATVGLMHLLLSLAAVAGGPLWATDFVAHFHPQLLAFGIVAVVAQAAVGSRRLAAVWGLGVAVNAWFVVPLYLPEAGGLREGDPTLTVAHYATDGGNTDPDAFAAWVAGTRPDLVFLTEFQPESGQTLLRGVVGYDVVASQPRDDTRGVALLARRGLDVSATVITPTPDSERPMVEAHLVIGGRHVALLGFHTLRPTRGDLWRWQGEGIEGLIVWTNRQRQAKREVVVVGDFNMSADGHWARHLFRETRLRDTRRGSGVGGTWPAHLPPFLRVPIDHAFISDGLHVENRRTGPRLGSDHLPVLVTVGPRR